MTELTLRFLAALLALASFSSRGNEPAVTVTYQPIITEDEHTPKGFTIFALPFWSYQSHDGPDYATITQPNLLLTDAPRSVLLDDRNLLSSAGVTIASPLGDELVYLHFENLHRPRLADPDLTEDDIAEAAFECLRRLAADNQARPKLRITGKPGEEAKWQQWQQRFEAQDLAKRFTRP